jgi:AcrR family transcriptional regulator
MSTENRRSAILAAVVPLLLEKGAAVTTAEMAQAAGIAEGTIFRVFPDKSRLIYEAVKTTMDPLPVKAAIEAISPSSTLAAKARAAAQILLDHFSHMTALAELLRSSSAPSASRRTEGRRLIAESSAEISAALAQLFEQHDGEFRVVSAKAIAALRGLVFASVHPLIPADERLTVDDVVTILLTGITRHSATR